MNQHETYQPAPPDTWGTDNLAAQPWGGTQLTVPVATAAAPQPSSKKSLFIVGAVVMVVIVAVVLTAIVGSMLLSDDGDAQAGNSAADSASGMTEFQNMPEAMVSGVPADVGSAVSHCTAEGSLLVLKIRDNVDLCNIKSGQMDSRGLEAIYYLDTTIQVELALTELDGMESQIYRSKGSDERHLAVHALSWDSEPTTVYLVDSPEPDKAIVYRFQEITEQDLVDFLEKYKILDQATTEAV